jgi:hypothetical protein
MSFQNGRVKSALIGQPDNLEGICYVLNVERPSELRSELRRLVEAWQKSGPNLAQLLHKDEELRGRTRHGRTLLVPTTVGKGHLIWLPSPPPVNALSWKDGALCHFMDLIVNPDWHKLGGPCCRCGKYYIKKTTRQKVYCSRQCGSRNTALATTRMRRREVQERKLQIAQSAVDEWRSLERRQPWKKWVSARTKSSVKWLTRAVNSGHLQVPSQKLDKGRAPKGPRTIAS